MRQWMVAEGISQAEQRKAPQVHQTWLRRLRRGEVVQIDSVVDALRTGRSNLLKTGHLDLAPTYEHRCRCWPRRVPLRWMRSELGVNARGALERVPADQVRGAIGQRRARGRKRRNGEAGFRLSVRPSTSGVKPRFQYR